MVASKKKTDVPLCFVLALAFLFFFLFLDWKPAQHDEGVNGWFIQEIIANGFYSYDPANYHGPLSHYIHFLFKIFLGDNLWALRLPAVLFGFGSVILILLWRSYVGRFVAYTAAFFAAVSPGMIFYSRYAIHESALLFFSLLSWLGFLRYVSIRDRKSLWLAGLGITGMLVTKETFVIGLGCFSIALFALKNLEKMSPSSDPAGRIQPGFGFKDILKVFSVCILITVVLYSGFFMNWKGVSGLFACFAEWFKIGASSISPQQGHWKPYIYWVQLFLQYEWPAAIGFLFVFPLLAPSPRWHRLVMIYGVINFLAYSVIPYKTPWCILQIIWPFLMVTAAGLKTFLSNGAPWKIAAWIIMAALGFASGHKAVSLNFFHYADDREKYPHVQTYEGFMVFHERLKVLSAEDPTLKHMPIHVVMKAYWPISWLLVNFTEDKYYTDNLPVSADARLIFCDVARSRRLEMRLKRPYFVERRRLNPAQDPAVIYYDPVIFRRFFSDGAEMFTPLPDRERLPGEGLLVKYFDNRLWEGEPVKQEIAGEINFGWEGKEMPMKAPFGLTFEGEIYIPQDGEITFYLASDDGSELYLDGERLIDHLGEHAESIKENKKLFKPGWYPLLVRHYDIGGAASLRLWWKLPSGEEERIDPGYFRVRVREEDQAE